MLFLILVETQILFDGGLAAKKSKVWRRKEIIHLLNYTSCYLHDHTVNLRPALISFPKKNRLKATTTTNQNTTQNYNVRVVLIIPFHIVEHFRGIIPSRPSICPNHILHIIALTSLSLHSFTRIPSYLVIISILTRYGWQESNRGIQYHMFSMSNHI